MYFVKAPVIDITAGFPLDIVHDLFEGIVLLNLHFALVYSSKKNYNYKKLSGLTKLIDLIPWLLVLNPKQLLGEMHMRTESNFCLC